MPVCCNIMMLKQPFILSHPIAAMVLRYATTLCTPLSCFHAGSLNNSCKDYNEPLGSIKGWEILE
jgi:hypothetical protein